MIAEEMAEHIIKGTAPDRKTLCGWYEALQQAPSAGAAIAVVRHKPCKNHGGRPDVQSNIDWLGEPPAEGTHLFAGTRTADGVSDSFRADALYSALTQVMELLRQDSDDPEDPMSNFRFDSRWEEIAEVADAALELHAESNLLRSGQPKGR